MAPHYFKIHTVLRSTHDSCTVVARLYARAMVDGFDFYALPAALLSRTCVLKEGHEGCGSLRETAARLRELGHTVNSSTGPFRILLPWLRPPRAAIRD